MERIVKWLIEHHAGALIGRLVAAVLAGLVGMLVDAGLLDGQLGEALLRLLSGS